MFFSYENEHRKVDGSHDETDCHQAGYSTDNKGRIGLHVPSHSMI